MTKGAAVMAVAGLCACVWAVGPALAQLDDDGGQPAVGKGRKEGKARPAAEKAGKGEKKVGAAVKDITVTGVVEKSEKAGKDGKAQVSYTLKTDAGAVIRLPAVRGPDISLADHVGQRVTVRGQGTETEKAGTKVVNLTKIAAIEKAADAGKPAGGAPESF